MTEAELRQQAAQVLPMGRMLERADYVEALVYFMSDASAMMTGEKGYYFYFENRVFFSFLISEMDTESSCIYNISNSYTLSFPKT